MPKERAARRLSDQVEIPEPRVTLRRKPRKLSVVGPARDRLGRIIVQPLPSPKIKTKKYGEVQAGRRELWSLKEARQLVQEGYSIKSTVVRTGWSELQIQKALNKE